jgi:hypothetical protein
MIVLYASILIFDATALAQRSDRWKLINVSRLAARPLKTVTKLIGEGHAESLLLLNNFQRSNRCAIYSGAVTSKFKILAYRIII